MLSPIHESSTTASLPEYDEYDQLDIDELFQELKKTHTVNKDEDDELTKIKKSIAKLPKLQDSDIDLSEQANRKHQPGHKDGIIHVNDPIPHKKTSTTEPQTSGSKWFDMPKGELTDSVKRDLKIIEQRAALDPKRHYKKDKWKTPEFFQIGTIVEGNTEFYSARLKNKERHSTILESVMYDDDTKKYFKRKYDEIQVRKTSGKKGYYKKVREARRRF
jgi:hypothetical protein